MSSSLPGSVTQSMTFCPILTLDPHDQTCSICLEPLHTHEPHNGTAARLHCNHTFGKECITQWLHSHISCPQCRRTAYDPSQQYLEWAHTTNTVAQIPGPGPQYPPHQRLAVNRCIAARPQPRAQQHISRRTPVRDDGVVGRDDGADAQ